VYTDAFAPAAQMMYGYAVMMLPWQMMWASPNDVAALPQMEEAFYLLAKSNYIKRNKNKSSLVSEPWGTIPQRYNKP
jgi:hypothetical protein